MPPETSNEVNHSNHDEGDALTKPISSNDCVCTGSHNFTAHLRKYVRRTAYRPVPPDHSILAACRVQIFVVIRTLISPIVLAVSKVLIALFQTSVTLERKEIRLKNPPGQHTYIHTYPAGESKKKHIKSKIQQLPDILRMWRFYPVHIWRFLLTSVFYIYLSPLRSYGDFKSIKWSILLRLFVQSSLTLYRPAMPFGNRKYFRGSLQVSIVTHKKMSPIWKPEI